MIIILSVCTKQRAVSIQELTECSFNRLSLETTLWNTSKARWGCFYIFIIHINEVCRNGGIITPPPFAMKQSHYVRCGMECTNAYILQQMVSSIMQLGFDLAFLGLKKESCSYNHHEYPCQCGIHYSVSKWVHPFISTLANSPHPQP